MSSCLARNLTRRRQPRSPHPARRTCSHVLHSGRKGRRPRRYPRPRPSRAGHCARGAPDRRHAPGESPAARSTARRPFRAPRSPPHSPTRTRRACYREPRIPSKKPIAATPAPQPHDGVIDEPTIRESTPVRARRRTEFRSPTERVERHSRKPLLEALWGCGSREALSSAGRGIVTPSVERRYDGSCSGERPAARTSC
jgi:hypothetical protein